MQDFFAVCVFERREGKVLSKKPGMIGFLKGSLDHFMVSGQFITTSAKVTPKGSDCQGILP